MKQGDKVYTGNGDEVEFLMKIDGRFVVRPLFESEDEEPAVGDPIIVAEVFAEPPVEKKASRVKELIEQIDKLEQQKRDISAEIRASQIDEKERLSRIKQNQALARIDDFLAGKITHFVWSQYSEVKVMSFDEALRYKERDYEKVPSGVRLVTLFGKTGGDLEWRISSYCDDSGSFKVMHVFTSLEDARDCARKIIDARYDDWRTGKETNDYLVFDGAKSAQELGFAVPADIAEMIRQKTLTGLRSTRDQKRKELDEAQSKLEALEFVNV